MNQDTVIGIGIGALVVWLLMRRRGLVGMGLVGAGGACCGSCAGHTAGAGPCSNLTGTGVNNYAQGIGPLPIRSF
jgi:hypothetical protein